MLDCFMGSMIEVNNDSSFYGVKYDNNKNDISMIVVDFDGGK